MPTRVSLKGLPMPTRVSLKGLSIGRAVEDTAELAWAWWPHASRATARCGSPKLPWGLSSCDQASANRSVQTLMSTVFPASPRAAIRTSRTESAGSQRPPHGPVGQDCAAIRPQLKATRCRHARQQPLRREPAGQHAAALLVIHVVTKGKAPNANEHGLDPMHAFRRRRRCASGHRQRLP
eukprot:scaffold79193_cov63-Phaeocystis_antarctica.AAC.9